METYIGIELANEAGEIIVLEVIWEQISGELRRSPHYERRPVIVPRYQVVHRWIVDELVGLCQERCWQRSLRVTSRKFACFIRRQGR